MGNRAKVPISERLALSVEDAASLLAISRSKAYQLIASGELPSVRLGGTIRVPRRALDELIDRAIEERKGA